MNVQYSKSFRKTVEKLSGKYMEAVRNMILEVKRLDTVGMLTDCKKLTGFDHIYRIRVGGYRAFFLFKVLDDTVYFEYFVSRGEAYNKEYTDKLRNKDKQND